MRSAIDRLHKKGGSYDYEICEVTLASYAGAELFGWEDENGKYNFGYVIELHCIMKLRTTVTCRA